MVELANTVVGALLFVAFGYVTAVSLLDGEKRAACVALMFTFAAPIPFLAAGMLTFPGQPLLGYALLGIVAVASVLFLIPMRSTYVWTGDQPLSRIDERDTMFSRRLLDPGSQRFNEYYARNPDKKAWDDKFRSRPGLLSRGSAQYDELTFHAAEASFDTIEKMRPFVDGAAAPKRIYASADGATRFVKSWVSKLGAHSVGITRLQEYHKYTVVGRGQDYGKPVELEHQNAIAFTVEMDKRMLDAGPQGPTVMESSQKYVDSGMIAVQVAKFIRSLGYQARAHIDGCYRVICPLVARDAGLGEIGRMGLLMTPDLGPRVRIAVVTTDMPLEPDRRTPDHSVLGFCTHCRKCATCCPPWAIPFDDRTEIEGVSRWRINQELCYIYWSHTGTDCGRCVSVCPYSHPNRLIHKLVRWRVRRSALARRAAIALDRLFYGKKPAPAPIPGWVRPTLDCQSEEINS